MEKKAIIAIVAVVAVIAIIGTAIALTQGGNKDSGDKYVTYYGNGGQTAQKETEIRLTQETVASRNLFTRDNYECTGWNTASDGSGTAYKYGDKVAFGTKLYAQWATGPFLSVMKNTYSSKFNFSLGATSADSVSIDAGGKYKVEGGYNIYVTIASGSISVKDNNITINVGDEYLYTVTPVFGSGAVIGSVSMSVGNMAVISFTFTSENPSLIYIISEKPT